MECLIRLTNHVLMGQVPETNRHIFFGATLITLRKKDGGLRSIGVGERIACVSKRVMFPMGDKLKPHQLGYGSTGGAEAAVHGARNFLQQNPAAILVKMHFKNVFSCFRMDHLLQAAAAHMPDYARFV